MTDNLVAKCFVVIQGRLFNCWGAGGRTGHDTFGMVAKSLKAG